MGNGGCTWWGCRDYCTGGFGNGEFFGENAYHRKDFLLTKDQILRFKAGETQFTLPVEINTYEGATLFRLTISATLYVATNNDEKEYDFKTNWNQLSIKQTPTVDNNATPLCTYNGKTYYGLLSISTKCDFTDGHDYASGSKGGNIRITEIQAKDGLVHTHNSNGIDYNQGNDNQHIKYTYCDGHGSDHSQNRSSGTWENHTWVTTKDWYNYDNTTMHQDQKCSKCGRTRTNSKTRTYYTNMNVLNPKGYEDNQSGYYQVSFDGTNWSSESVNGGPSGIYSLTYNSPVFIRFIRPYYDYYELKKIVATAEDDHWFSIGDNLWQHPTVPTKNLEQINDNTWKYIVTVDRACIEIYMDYKHTTLTLDPNGGTINGNSSPQALSPQMQYSTSNWWNVSSEEPIRNGYTFEGWYDAVTGGTKVYDTEGKCIRGTKYFDSNGNSLCVNDLTVYAHWKINTYNIYYTLYGSNASLQRTYTVESNNFALPTNPTLQGYTFKGWIGGIDQKDSVKKGNTYQTPTQNITVEKGSYGDYFFRAIFEKAHSVSDGINTDDVYIAQSVSHEKQY